VQGIIKRGGTQIYVDTNFSTLGPLAIALARNWKMGTSIHFAGDGSGFVSAGLVLCHQTEPSLEGKMVTVSGPGT